MVSLPDRYPFKRRRAVELWLLVSPVVILLLCWTVPHLPKTWHEAYPYTLHTYPPGNSGVAFSPTGDYLVSCFSNNASRPSEVVIWDLRSKTRKSELKRHDKVHAVAYSPDGRTIAFAGDYVVGLWDGLSTEPHHTMSIGGGFVRYLAFSPDGSTLAGGLTYDGTVKLWDSSSGALLYTLQGTHGVVTSLRFSPDGKLLASAVDKALTIFEVETGKVMRTITFKGDPSGQHTFHIQAAGFAPDSRTLALLYTEKRESVTAIKIALWDAQIGARLRAPVFEPTTQFDTPWTFDYSRDGKMICVGSSRALHLWDARTGRLLWDEKNGHYLTTWKWSHGHVRSCAFSPDGQTIACGADSIDLLRTDYLISSPPNNSR